MKKFIIFFFIFCSSLSLANTIKPSDITLNADELFHNQNNSEITLKGNVKLLFSGYYFAADHAVVNFKTSSIDAHGNVVLQNSNSYIEAEKINFNYNTQKAKIFNGFIQAGNTSFQGDYIERINEDTYIADNSTFTTCTDCPEMWSISGRRIKATIGGYAHIKRPVLRVLDFPIFALPALIIPLKNKRQTGLLTPGLEQSSINGFSITQPFFWNISPHQDSTTSLKIYDSKGIKTLQEYRYSLGPGSRGQLNFGYLRDNEFSNSGISDAVQSQRSRNFLRYLHLYKLKYGIVQRTELNYVSDLRYLRDFPEDLEEPGNSSLENNISFTKNFDRHHLSVLANYNQNLLQTDPFANNSRAIHKLPEIRYSLIEHKISKTPLLFKMDLNYTRFHRTGRFFDDVCDADNPCNDGQEINDAVPKRIDKNGDGIFDPDRDLIRAGQRIDFSPTVSLPLQVADAFDINTSLKWRETFYRFSVDSSSSNLLDNSTARGYLEPSISLRTNLSQVFGNEQNMNTNLYKHVIEPEIEYAEINMIQEPDHPFFGDFKQQSFDRTNQPITDEDFWGDDKIQFDYNDRVSEKKLLSFNLTNRIIKKEWLEGKPYYKEVFYFKLSQSYDFFEERKDNPRPWTRLNGIFKVRLKNIQISAEPNYNPYENALNNTSKIRVSSDDGRFAELSYQHLLNESDDFSHTTRTEFASIGAGFRSRYVDFRGDIEYSLVKNEIRAWSYQAVIKPPGKCFKLYLNQRQAIDRPGIDTTVYPDFGFESTF